jgi:predicted nuclease with RNAse H fold
MPLLGEIQSPRRSCIAELSADGRLHSLSFAQEDDDIMSSIPESVSHIVVDAPLEVPNENGARPIERLLGWLDIPAFPHSRQRDQQIFGGTRGDGLRTPLTSRNAHVAETSPDAVLKQLLWEQRPMHARDIIEFADYRAYWHPLRPPRYRPKAGGRATANGFASIVAILDGVVDLAGWEPTAHPDDWDAIRDAAALDAIICAVVAWRWAYHAGSTVQVSSGYTPFIFASDVFLGQRIGLHAERTGVSLLEDPADPHRAQSRADVPLRD